MILAKLELMLSIGFIEIYVTGLEVKKYQPKLTLSDEISVDDNAFMIVRLNNKARGSLRVFLQQLIEKTA